MREIENKGWISEQDLRLQSWQANLHLTCQIPKAIWELDIQKGMENNELWSVSGSGAIGPLSANLVQECITRKEKQVATYRKRCSELWLLVVVGGGEMSSMFASNDDSFCRQNYESSFDRVFLLHSLLGHVYPLSIRGPQSPTVAFVAK